MRSSLRTLLHAECYRTSLLNIETKFLEEYGADKPFDASSDVEKFMSLFPFSSWERGHVGRYICDLADVVEDAHKKFIFSINKLKAFIGFPYVYLSYSFERLGFDMCESAEKCATWVNDGRFTHMMSTKQSKIRNLTGYAVKSLMENVSCGLEDYSI